MPKVLARDPAWLSRNAPASNLFRPSSDAQNRSLDRETEGGVTRRIARRGAEVFVAVGNELRWANLAQLRDAGEAHGRHGRDGHRDEEKLYKVWKTYRVHV